MDVLPNARYTQSHGKWAEKDRNFAVTLTIEPVFMRVTREGVKIMVVLIGLVIIFKSQLTSLVQTIFEKITSESSGI
nr:Flp1 family type IVb pilin [Dorea longicatena]